MSLHRRILISRTDAIGDVILTLPLATILKQKSPDAHIGFLGKSYTQAVIKCCGSVDEFVDVQDFLHARKKKLQDAWDTIIHVFPRKDIAIKAWQARIAQRIGTSNRAYHWLTCNSLVKLSRRNSMLHEAQLNTQLLTPFGIDKEFSKEELSRLFSFDSIPELPESFRQLLEPGKRHIILHPKSQGSAREWGVDNFASLVSLLPSEKFQIFISGTKKEALLLGSLFDAVGTRVTDITGQMDLSTFIAFINACDALVAASTGPLHIAAALGKQAIGIYPPIRPMDPGRWAPLGPHAVALVMQKECGDCRKVPEGCHCMHDVTPAEVRSHLEAGSERRES